MGDSYPGGNGVLTYQQIENLWTNNGGDPKWAPLMAAIAEAESSGHPGVLNDTPATGDYSVGLWQINMGFGNEGRAAQGIYGGGPGMGYQQVAAKLANDPNQQAKAAVSLFANGAGASNWQGDAAWKLWKANGAPAYPTQAQIQGWGASTASSGGTPYTGGASGASGGTPNGAGGSNAPAGISVPILGQIISGQQELTIKGWFLMIAGGAIGVVGLAVVLASLGLESKAGQAAVEVAPGGAAVKAAAGRPATTQRSRAQTRERTAARRQEERVQLTQERGSQRRATDASRQTRSIRGARRGESESARNARWEREGFAPSPADA